MRVLAVLLLALHPAVPALAGARETVEIVTKAGPVAFSVEIADEEAERQRGLMHRRDLTPDQGMLFQFEREGPLAFWMKNTPLSLDILFISGEGRILAIAARTTPFSTESIPSGGPARGVLEILGGEAERRGIAVGDLVRHPFFQPSTP